MLKSTQGSRTKRTRVTSLMASQHEHNIHHILAAIIDISRNGASLGKKSSPKCLSYLSGGINADKPRNRRIFKKKKRGGGCGWLSKTICLILLGREKSNLKADISMDKGMRKGRTEGKSCCWKKLSCSLKCRGWVTGPDTGNNVHKIRNAQQQCLHTC